MYKVNRRQEYVVGSWKRSNQAKGRDESKKGWGKTEPSGREDVKRKTVSQSYEGEGENSRDRSSDTRILRVKS